MKFKNNNRLEKIVLEILLTTHEISIRFVEIFTKTSLGISKQIIVKVIELLKIVFSTIIFVID